MPETKTTTVNDFLNHKVQPEHQDIVSLIRKLMRELAPEAREVITYGILAWKGNRILAVMNPTTKNINLAFSRGAEFEDKYGLLQGE